MKIKKINILAFAFAFLVPHTFWASPDPWLSVEPSSTVKAEAFDIGSIFFLDFDIERKIINQTQGGENLVLDDFSGGFRVIENHSLSIGNPPLWHFQIPAGIPIGLIVAAGTHVSADRFAKDLGAVKSLPKLAVPLRASSLEGWTVGDTLTYGATGGVGFTVGVGWHGVGTGPYFFAEGQWMVYIEKTTPTTAYLKITKSAIHSLGASVGSNVFAIGVEHFSQADTAFSFSYDLTDAQAVKAYEDAIRGNLAPSEQMADAPGAAHVQRQATHRNAFLGFVRYWYFGLPIFWNVSGANGKIYAINQERLHADNTKSLVHYAVAVNESAINGFLSNHRRTLRNFYAYHFSNAGLRGRQSEGFSGKFLWGFEQERVNQKQFKKALSELIRDLNLHNKVGLQIPNEKFGYLNIEFEAMLSESTTELLLETANRSSEEGAALLFGAAAQDELERYFADGKDPDRLCERTSRTDATLSLAKCISRLKLETEAAMKSAVSELRLMETAKNKDAATFVQHFAAFGKLLTENRFVFEGITRLAQSEPVAMSLTIEGERVSVLNKDITHALLF